MGCVGHRVGGYTQNVMFVENKCWGFLSNVPTVLRSWCHPQCVSPTWHEVADVETKDAAPSILVHVLSVPTCRFSFGCMEDAGNCENM